MDDALVGLNDIPGGWFPSWNDHGTQPKPEFDYAPIVNGISTAFWMRPHTFVATGADSNDGTYPEHRVLISRFDSREQLAWYLRDTPIPDYAVRRGMDSSIDPPSNWNGDVTWAKSLDLLESGWHGKESEKLARSSLEAALDCPPFDFNPKLQYMEEGEHGSVERYLAGMEEHWAAVMPGARKSKAKRGTVVRVTVNTSVSWSVSSKAIFRAGMCVAVAIVALERAGLSVELSSLTMYSPIGNEEPVCAQFVPIKMAGQPIDFGVLAYMLAHPAWPRRNSFAIQERQAPKFVDNLSSCYGRPMKLKDSVVKDMLCPEIGLMVNIQDIADEKQDPFVVLNQLLKHVRGDEEAA